MKRPLSPLSWMAGPLARWIFLLLLAGSARPAAGALAQCVPSPAGLVSWWRAEGDGSDRAGANHGTVGGGLGFTAGQVGQAFNFTGAGQQVVAPASASLHVGIGSGFTIEAWVYPSQTNSQMPIAEWGDSLGTGTHFWLNVSFGMVGGPGALYAATRFGDSSFFASPPGIVVANVWQHVAFTYDMASGVERLYLNGVEVASKNIGSVTGHTDFPLNLGRRFGGDTFQGRLDEVSLYQRALSAAELQAIYNAGAAGKCPPVPPNGPGMALSFDGVDDYLSAAPAGLPVANSAYTIEAWIRPDLMHVGAVAAWGDYAPNQANAFVLDVDGLANYWWGNDLKLLTTNLAGAWHHVAATFDGTTRRILLDGVVLTNDTPMGHAASASNFRIGRANLGQYFDGFMDEVRIWNVARSAAQIQADMRRQVTNGLPGLVAYYRLDEGSGVIALDSSLGNAATLVNGPTWTNSTILPFAPTITTLPASPSSTHALFQSVVNPNGNSTVVTYEWGLTTGYGSNDFGLPRSLGNGTSSIPTAVTHIGLRPGTTYHYRAVAVNGHGASFGADEVFTTPRASSSVVSNLNDSGLGSLRQAIAETAPGGTVTFAVSGGTSVLTSPLVITQDLVIVGPGAQALTLSGNQATPVFSVTSGGVRISGLSVTDGRATGATGVTGTIGTGGPGGTGAGGGILNLGDLTLTDCMLLNNVAEGGVGGLGGISGFNGLAGGTGGTALGAAICNSNRLTLLHCTFFTNHCLGGMGGMGRNDSDGFGGNGGNGGAGGPARGGAIFNAGWLVATNCTFFANTVGGGSGGTGGRGRDDAGRGGDGVNGGGGAIVDGGTSAVVNCTIAGNSAFGGAGGSGGTGFPNGAAGANSTGSHGGLRQTGMAAENYLRNTIVANNTAASVRDLAGSYVSGGFNLLGVTGDGQAATGFTNATDQVGTLGTPVNPQFGVFGNYGGTTLVLPLLTNSPATDKGHSSGVLRDQRGFLRAVDVAEAANGAGDGADIGAFELHRGALYLVTNTLPGLNAGSLRWAIVSATINSIYSANTVGFNIPGPGPHTIRLTTALPPITRPVTIDGYTQPGARPNTLAVGSDAVLKIELDGSGVTNADGLTLSGGNSVVRGLVINRIQNLRNACAVYSDGNTLVGNFIGVDPTGTLARTNTSVGIYFYQCRSNVVGGVSPADRNVISGNENTGIIIHNMPDAKNRIEGNYIGVNAAGTMALPNFVGIYIAHPGGNFIGGAAVGAGNLISGNREAGIALSGTTFNQIAGNVIGLNADATAPIPNGLGVGIPTSTPLSTNNAILGNSISGNAGLGIDLGNDPLTASVTANDAGDGDEGPNHLQNFPLITNASSTVQGALNSQPNTAYRLEFFSNAAADPSGYGEGETFLGATNVTTDGAGNAAFTFIPASLLPVGRLVTATATDPAGNTSEFSFAAAVSEIITVSSVSDSGPGSLRQAMLDANARAGRDTIAFNIPGPGPHTIAPASPLPFLSFGVTIDGYTQPGAAPPGACGAASALKIELNGANAGNGVSGLVLVESNLVRGLVINRFRGSGIVLDSEGGNVIEGNYIGTDVTGTIGLGNGDFGVWILESSGNLIGGSCLQRNVISSNRLGGVYFEGFESSNNVVAGNFIGTCAAGVNPLGNGGNGVTVSSPNNVIGGNVPAARNLISGHISTNGGTGVLILGPAATENVVAGNYIGTDATGTNALPNSVGIYLDATTNAIVGGPSAASRNVIAANFFGIVIISGGGHVVQGNYIGTDASGGIGIGNNFGIYVKRSADNTLGGAVPGAGNVISGNVSYGVLMEENVTGTRIQGNLIGTDATATRALGNGTAGIAIVDVRDTLVGGTTAGAGNVISHNGQFGVTVPGTNTTNNAILGNSIFANGGLGIDLGGDGVTLNDLGDTDGSPNHLQNFPVITNASTTVQGILNSRPNTTYRLEFFSNTSADPSGFGEGEMFLGSTNVTTDGAGNAGFTFIPAYLPPAGQWVTATATDPAGNTSEFSPAAVVSEVITVSSVYDFGPGSLRQAILDANARGGRNTIAFNIPGPGPHTIAPASPLPFLSFGVTIDGYTQPGAFPPGACGAASALKIELNGANAGNGVGGLVLVESNLVRGLVINRFRGSGIVLAFEGRNVIEGNYIGTDVTGTIGLGNGDFGVWILDSSQNVIGGSCLQRNVISSNRLDGVHFEGLFSSNNVVAGNFIGTCAAGINPLGNGENGVRINTPNNVIGGTNSAARNLIAQNRLAGVVMKGTQATNNPILGNSIFANGGLGIDLGGDGVTLNDLGDIDGSPNHLQNFPVLTAVTHNFGLTYIQGWLNSASNRTFRVEFFANDAVDPSGHGEGQTFLTALNMTTGIDGNVGFLVPSVGVPSGRFITATATDPDGNTSEFSLAIPAGDPNAPVIRVNGQVVFGAVTVTNSAVVSMEGGFTNGHFFYTVDGSDPTFGLVYSAPFVVQQTATLRAIAFDAGYDLDAEAPPLIVNVVVQRAPQIVRQPEGVVQPVGGLAVFEVVADGSPPLAFQWRRNGTPLANETNAALVLTNLQPAQAGNFNVVITNAFGAVTSVVAVLAVVPLPGIDKQPENATVPAGGRVVFSVTATGVGPFSYQWRKTGVNIPGATDDMLIFDPARLTDSGTYDVVVVNAAGAVTSDPAVLVVTTNAVVGGDFFAGRIPLGSAAAGFINGTNTNATLETGEPEHGGKRGSNSIWFKWSAPANGVAVFETSGSSFDTLLGVYTGSAVGALATAARGEDNGDYLSSVARFSAASGVEYAIAVDGFAGGQGRFVLGWRFVATNNPLPIITAQPPSFLTVTQGASVSLSVTASAGGDPLDYQWHLNLQPLPGATSPMLALASTQPTDVGFYKLAITNRTTRQGIESEFFVLEIGVNTNAHSVDKYEDLVGLVGGGGGGQGGAWLAPAQLAPGGSLVIRAGDVDSHFLNNTVATTQIGEPNHCGLQVSRSAVMSVRSDVTATCFINTFGSAIATILAVYEADALGSPRLDRPVDCGASGGPGAGATVQFAAVAGRYYTVFVDGLAGDRGLIRLNWAVSAQAVPSSTPAVFKVRRGSRATLSVGIENLAAYTYQWRHNGTNLPNAFTARLTLTNVQPADAGDYGVALRGATASETRHVATLEVDTTTQVLAYSVFESDAENWLAIGNVKGPTHFPLGGNPDGCLSATATNVSTNAWFWTAPPKFLGNQFSAYEGVLEFDLRQATGSATLTNQPDVVLQSSGLSISFTMGQAPSSAWTSFKVPLKETVPGWKVGEGLSAGPVPTQAQMLSVLRALIGIKIRGRFTSATNTFQIDNVALVGLCTNNTVVLNWEKLGGNRLHLEWPVSAVCLQLETATSLAPPDWQVPVEPPTVRNNTNIFELDMNEPRRFFRLRQP